MNVSVCSFFVFQVDIPKDLHGAWSRVMVTWLSICMVQEVDGRWPGSNHHHHKQSMSTYIETPLVCIVCKSDSKRLVTDPDVNKVQDILHNAKRLADLGEVAFRPQAGFLSFLSISELEKVRYHSDCRKRVVNKTLLEICHPSFSITSDRKEAIPHTISSWAWNSYGITSPSAL